MLQLTSVSKSIGVRTLFHDVSFVVNPGECIGLAGPNGSGKTTLLRLIAGADTPDEGAVHVGHGMRMGYLPQGFHLNAGLTVRRAIWDGIPGYVEAQAEVERLALRLADPDLADLDAAMEAYQNALETFEALGGYEIEYRAETVLGHLGLDDVALDTPLAALSGGQRTRMGLARLLVAEPDVLLLDEPTNHLDIAALEWLESFLASYAGAVLVVSHDRTFLDAVADSMVILDPRSLTARQYPGGYSDYDAAHQDECEKQLAAWKDQVAEEKRIEEAVRRIADRAETYQAMSKHDFQRRKSRVLMQKAMAQKTRLEKMLDDGDRIDKPVGSWGLRIDFGTMPRGGGEVIRLAELTFGYDGAELLFKDVSALLRHGERVALLGPNGAGKSTLLRLIMGDILPQAGQVIHGSNIKLGYMPQEQETLDPAMTPYDVIRRARPMSETEARSFLHYFLFAGDEVFKKIGDLSYGERARVILARIILGGANCLVLDEPLNHLDIEARGRFLEALESYPGTVLFTAHDRAFIDAYATRVWSVEDGGLVMYHDRAAMRG